MSSPFGRRGFGVGEALCPVRGRGTGGCCPGVTVRTCISGLVGCATTVPGCARSDCRFFTLASTPCSVTGLPAKGGPFVLAAFFKVGFGRRAGGCL